MFEDIKGKKLLIVGGEASITNIVREAKAMGVYTIVAERGTDLNKLPAKAIADEAWDFDYSATEALAAKCREAGVDGVFTGYSEGKLYYAARLAEALGTPFYATSEQVEITRNKRSFKELCMKYGIPVPHEYCKSGKMTEEEKAAVRFPVIVKPADYGGRIGISLCTERADLDEALALAESKSISHSVVVEEYIEGLELSAIYTIADGEYSLSIINDKYLSQEGKKYCLCDAAITPSKYYDRYMKEVDPRIKDFLRGIGIRNGIAVFQLIANEEKITAFEMALRLNGGNDWMVLEQCNGINYMRMLIHFTLTGSMGDTLEKDDPTFKNEFVTTYIVYAHGGKVAEIDLGGIETMEGLMGISRYVYVGKEIIDKGTTQQRVFSFKVRTKTMEDLADKIRYIQDQLVVKDTEGRNMLFGRFDASRILW